MCLVHAPFERDGGEGEVQSVCICKPLQYFSIYVCKHTIPKDADNYKRMLLWEDVHVAGYLHMNDRCVYTDVHLGVFKYLEYINRKQNHAHTCAWMVHLLHVCEFTLHAHAQTHTPSYILNDCWVGRKLQTVPKSLYMRVWRTTRNEKSRKLTKRMLHLKQTKIIHRTTI